MLLIKFKCINMNLLKKFFSFFISKKTKMLRKFRKGDKINIYPPKGYHIAVNGSKHDKQVMTITVYNNDPKARKIWFYQKVDGQEISFVKSYNSEIFEDFILLNYSPETFEETKFKSKKDLEKEMQDAISQENYELANLLNEEIKKIR